MDGQGPDRETEMQAFSAAMEDFDSFQIMLMVREAVPALMALQIIHQLPAHAYVPDPEWRAFIRAVAVMLEAQIVKRHPELKAFLARGWKLGE